MKNKKLGIFAILGVLTISGIGFATTSGTDILANLVKAEQTYKCNLTWDASNKPTLNNGDGTLINKTVQTSYHKAANSIDGHVRLNIGGNMKTTDAEWNGQYAGFANGIQSITVNFSNKSSDAYGSTGADLKLSAGLTGSSDVLSGEYIESGVTFEFSLPLPRSFTLSFPSSTYGSTSGYCEISSIVIGCTAKESIGFKTNYGPFLKEDIIWYESDKDFNRGDAIYTDIPKYPFVPGTVIAFKAKESCESYVGPEDFTVSGATVTTKIVGEEKYPTHFLTINKTTILDITKKSKLPVYANSPVIGTYSLVDGMNVNLKASFELKDTGEFIFKNDSRDFAINDKGKPYIVKEEYGTSYSLKSTGDYVCLVADRGYGNKNVYVGAKGESVDVVSKSNSFYSFLGTINGKYFVQWYGHILVDGEETVKFVFNPNNNVYTITAIPDAHDDSLISEAFGRPDSITVDGVSHHVQYLQVSDPSTGAIKNVDLGIEAGTYKNSNNETLVLDGFGYATLNDKPATTYKFSDGIITLKDGSKYALDLTNKTFKEHSDAIDPWATARKRYTSPNSTSWWIELEKGKAYIYLDGIYDSELGEPYVTDYRIVGSTIKFSAPYYFKKMGGIVADGTADFEFSFDSDAIFLTCTKTIIAKYHQGFNSTNESETITKNGDLWIIA